MNKKHVVVFILAFSTFVSAGSLQAQVKNSIYSMFGVGQIIDNGFGINKSLGGTGIAFQSGQSINYMNPAAYLGMLPHSFIMEIGAYGIYNRSENVNTSQTDGDIKVSFFSASLYFKRWWASSFGIVPYSSVDYEINSSDEIGGELGSFDKNFTGTGGLNRAYWGHSFKIYKGLAVGFNASYIFGPITQTETAVSHDGFAGYELKNERTVHGSYLDYGLQYTLNQNNWSYTIGVIHGASKRLSVTDDLEMTYNGITSPLEQDDRSDVKIPQKFGVGISAKRSVNFRIGLDYEWRNWATISLSNPNLDTKNSNRYSLGVEYSPVQKDNWLKSLYYRLGANYRNSYLEIDNTPINSRGMNFGIGIPCRQTSMFNLSVEFGEEGTLNKGLIKSSYWMFYLSFSLHEFWARGSRRN